MNTREIHGRRPPSLLRKRGFALVVTLSMMVLLALLAVGLLSLSTIALRSTDTGGAMAEARANARLALIIAVGELQKEMGPDMRVSAEAAIFDQTEASEKIDGVNQSRWLASYDSWGGWLNADYTPPGRSTLQIQDTYTPRREAMFRRWLVSLPEAARNDVSAPLRSGTLDESNSVILVGAGSLGDSAQSHPDRVTRAYLTRIGDTGRQAWWIGPENHKARIDKAKQPRNLAATDWEVSQGDTAEVGIGVLPGFGGLDADGSLSEKLATRQTLRPAGIDADSVDRHFFDLTPASRGVLASVRTGHLKKDLSLLFEKDKSELPEPYRFDPGDIREPSIRPMSPEIAGKAVLPARHFAPWPRMRHFYRMYRQDSDALAPGYPYGTPSSPNTDGAPALRWSGALPWADCNFSTRASDWDGQDSYPRFPIVTHITYILKLRTTPNSRNATERNLESLAAPVYVLWNPYNVELRVPDKAFMTRDGLSEVQPLEAMIYRPDGTQDPKTQINWSQYKGPFSSHHGPEMSDVRDDIVFKPGQFRIFSPLRIGELQDSIIYHPGFDPSLLGGADRGLDATARINQEPPRCEFHIGWGTYYRWNTRKGNTPASFVAEFRWLPARNPNDSSSRSNLPLNQHVDWFNTQQYGTLISPQGGDRFLLSDSEPLEVGYFQLVLKGLRDHSYPTISWEQDWRCRNWIQAPPYYFVKGLYMSEDPKIAHTQRIDCPYEFRFGPIAGAGLDFDDIVPNVGESALMGPELPITAAPALELPTAPIGNLAGFSGMRVNPGWTNPDVLNSRWGRSWSPAGSNTTGNSLYGAESKANAYQSGITGPGIGNSFLHPMIGRTEVYRFFNNSISMEMLNEEDVAAGHAATDTQAYCDYWDHVLLLNDALWDDYFVSSLADQTRPGASAGASLDANLEKLVNGEPLANSRYLPHLGGRPVSDVKADLEAEDGYLKAAAHLMVDGIFNVNSTSVDAWHALFAGIRERQVVYRDQNGNLKTVEVPSGKRIALSRFNTATTDQEGIDPTSGIDRDDGMKAWSGVRFLDDDQLRKLAEECVKQVKRRGPFLNFSEFINRRLSNDDLGIMGALQAAIDYDDDNPESGSINYDFKSSSDYMLDDADLGNHEFQTPEAAVGSRFAGIPGYVIQSDLLKPIANTLSVRDDTFRIRAYGESVDENGEVIARAWCEAIVQRIPEYSDPANGPEVPARRIDADGNFSDLDDSDLTPVNRRFGRRFEIEGFRWLNASEV
ncbi:hypothetical protein [Haloferula sp. A504]|uniref:hypothetical protein n=1 Tax=Haloferula sp. A504 TaxID=3373601 RepID=UPI0031C54447|nr:hypothetical protein [Verrucomicrobiaceae bacterium E54]